MSREQAVDILLEYCEEQIKLEVSEPVKEWFSRWEEDASYSSLNRYESCMADRVKEIATLIQSLLYLKKNYVNQKKLEK